MKRESGEFNAKSAKITTVMTYNPDFHIIITSNLI
jgi:hypothetical protein